jgi:RNA polymerase sigma-70 factor (ECF subfamily)
MATATRNEAKRHIPKIVWLRVVQSTMRPAARTQLTDESMRARLAPDPEGPLPGEVWTVEEMADETAGSGFAQLVLVHQPQLHGRALCFCRNTDEARDLVQDTFERALKHFTHLRPNSNIRGWLMTIMVNLYRDAQKRRYRSREVAFEEWHDVAELPPPAPAHAALEPEQLDAAMAKLPPELLQLLNMKVVQGLRYRDIGERLGIPANTVGTRLRQARKALCQLLGMARLDDQRD